jgi:hypothetical protein
MNDERFERARFFKASGSGDVGCVEVAFAGDVVGVRDSKAPNQAVLVFAAHEWDVFIQGMKNGEFDRR